ncbi:MAG: TrkA family potassium uptake protein [Chloroflexi bacterium]|nr:TrkA family potassium uptake protein [Chloroflexota bacterium]
MNIVIMGSGRVGATLANRLSKEGHHVGIIDITSEAFERYLDPEFKGRTVLGDGIDEDVLRKAGIATADAFVAAAHGDNHNLMAAQIAKVIFGVKRVVTRCNDPVRMELYEALGLATISPSLIAARSLYDLVMDERLHERDVAAEIERALGSA